MMRRLGRFGRPKPPAGWEVIGPTLEALEVEMREGVNKPHEGRRKAESQWPIHQITWQRSRYVHDMYAKYKRISRRLYDYCIREKLIDGLLCAKWKKPGYNRLCSIHVINSRNTNYGTTSICRVPRQQLAPGQVVEAQLTGCRGCCSGKGGYNNIFGNKYGQYLAAIQIAREEAAKNKGTAYEPDKSKEGWQYAEDYEEVVASKGDASKVAKAKKGEIDLSTPSWLGGNQKRKAGGDAEEESKRTKIADDEDKGTAAATGEEAAEPVAEASAQ